jgi:hypothetical protein
MPTIKSTHSLVAKYVTGPIWEKLSKVKTKVRLYMFWRYSPCCNLNSRCILRMVLCKKDGHSIQSFSKEGLFRKLF